MAAAANYPHFQGAANHPDQRYSFTQISIFFKKIQQRTLCKEAFAIKLCFSLLVWTSPLFREKIVCQCCEDIL